MHASGRGIFFVSGQHEIMNRLTGIGSEYTLLNRSLYYILCEIMRQQMPFIALWPTFGITPEIKEKLIRISPATIGHAPKKTKPPSLSRANLSGGGLFSQQLLSGLTWRTLKL
jgi:hypothetical protein